MIRTAPSASISSAAAGSKARNAAYWADAGAIAHTDKTDTSSGKDLSNCIPPVHPKYTRASCTGLLQKRHAPAEFSDVRARSIRVQCSAPRGASLKASEQPIDTSTAAGKCFLDMLGAFAEFETGTL